MGLVHLFYANLGVLVWKCGYSLGEPTKIEFSTELNHKKHCKQIF